MSPVNVVAWFIALCAFVFIDVVCWRNVLMGPPAQRRLFLVAAIVGLVAVLTMVWNIVFLFE